MQEIKKRRIVLASILKPVNETRMFEKFGQSLSTKFDVVILGFPCVSQSKPDNPSLRLWEHQFFQRLGLRRWLTPWKLFSRVYSLKPDCFVICTHELMLQGTLLKMMLGCRLIYDVQENYYRNILYTDAFPRPLRWLIATYVRTKEIFFSRFFDHFILAENTYQIELPFAKNRSTVVENKFVPAPGIQIPIAQPGTFEKFLFTGTLSRTTGVFEAIELVEALHQLDPRISLTIAGRAVIKEDLDLIKVSIIGKPFITLIGGNDLVPHYDILALICSHDVGIISYQPNRATDNRMPTKMFEYLACRLPILVTNRFDWSRKPEENNAGFTYDPARFDAETILTRFRQSTFYSHPLPDVYWVSEEKKLFAVFERIKL